MNSVLGRLYFGTWELGQNRSDTSNLTGTFTVGARSSVSFTGSGGRSVDRRNAIPGLIIFGQFELGQVIADVRANSIAKSGNFNCNAQSSVSFLGELSGGKFTVNATTAVSFTAVPHVHFQVDARSSVSFSCVGTVTGSFISSASTSVSFASSAVEYPRFRVDAKSGVEFFVRKGQGPPCYYDNGYIDPNNRIKNYVF